MWRGESQISGKGKLRLESGGGRRKKWKSARWRVNDNESDGFMQSPERRNCTNRLGGVNRQTHWPTEPSGRRRHNYRHTHTHTHTHNVHRENQSLRILGKNVKSNQHLYNCWRHPTHWDFACTNTRALLYEILHSLNSYCKILPLTSVNCDD